MRPYLLELGDHTIDYVRDSMKSIAEALLDRSIELERVEHEEREPHPYAEQGPGHRSVYKDGELELTEDLRFENGGGHVGFQYIKELKLEGEGLTITSLRSGVSPTVHRPIYWLEIEDPQDWWTARKALGLRAEELNLSIDSPVDASWVLDQVHTFLEADFRDAATRLLHELDEITTVPEGVDGPRIWEKLEEYRIELGLQEPEPEEEEEEEEQEAEEAS